MKWVIDWGTRGAALLLAMAACSPGGALCTVILFVQAAGQVAIARARGRAVQLLTDWTTSGAVIDFDNVQVWRASGG